MVRVARDAGFYEYVCITPQTFFDQVVMDAARRQQSMHRQEPRLQVAVTQYQQELAIQYGLLRLPADLVQCILQRHVFRPVQIDECVLVSEHRRPDKLTQFSL